MDVICSVCGFVPHKFTPCSNFDPEHAKRSPHRRTHLRAGLGFAETIFVRNGYINFSLYGEIKILTISELSIDNKSIL
jgi:hypothetical protein